MLKQVNTFAHYRLILKMLKMLNKMLDLYFTTARNSLTPMPLHHLMVSTVLDKEYLLAKK